MVYISPLVLTSPFLVQSISLYKLVFCGRWPRIFGMTNFLIMFNDYVTNKSATLWDAFLLLFVICIFWTAFISSVGPFWGFSETLASRVMWQYGSGGPLEDDLQGQSNTVWVREHESIIATKRKKDMNSVSFERISYCAVTKRFSSSWYIA